jgi:hypothetical protein
VKVKARDVGGLAVLVSQAPVLSAVMYLVFPRPTREMLFMLSLSCMWFGMSAAVRELLADRVIWLRERRIGVRAAPYVWSKMYVLAALVGAQCAAFAGLNLALHPIFFTEYHVNVAQFVGVSALTGFVGMALGLLISAINISSEGAVGMLLIPQIALSGLLLKLGRMSWLAQKFSSLNPARFAYDALMKTMESIGVPATFGLDIDTLPIGGQLYGLGFADGGTDTGIPLPMLVARLLIFAVFFLVSSLFTIWRRRE